MSADSTATDSVLPRRLLRPLLYLALSRHDRSYGYELAETVRGYGLAIDMAGIYRELRAMEQHDLLESDWEPSASGPDRRVYQLTASGVDRANEAVERLVRIRDSLHEALEPAPSSIS